MLNFNYQNKTRIIFGKDTEKKAGAEVKAMGSKVLIHYGGGSVIKSGLLDRVKASLDAESVPYVELGGVQPNPRVSLVREGIALCREHGVDCILAVGGGSVIDSAKAIAIGVDHEGDVWDFFTGSARIKKLLPIGVVLTIPAAGSESSTGTVITNDEGGYKRSCGHSEMRPRFAIMNPEVTYSLPPYQTACGITDMLAHVMERYFTNEKGVGFTDQLCEATMRSIMEEAAKVMENPNDYDTRANIMWAGTVAHNGFLGVGRIEDWASHNIEHELSGIYDIAHGAGLAIIFPAWMRYVYQHDLDRFCRFAENVFDIPRETGSKDAVALQGIRALTGFFESIGMPTSLKEAGLPTDQLELMAKKAVEGGPLGGFVKLNEDDVLRILEMAQ